MTKPLRIGLIGAGRMGISHARAMRRLPAGMAELTAFVDPAPAARAEVLSAWPNAVACESVDELLAPRLADVVHICTPYPSHVNLAGRALAAGCHVYIEKPFAPTLREAEELITLGRERGLQICAGHQLLFEDITSRVEALLPALGAVVHIESYFSFAPSRRGPANPARLASLEQLLDVLPHPTYLLHHFLRRASDADRAEVTSLQTGPGGTLHAAIRRGAVTGSLVATIDGRPVQSYVRIVGTRGMLHADYVAGAVLTSVGQGTSIVDKVINPFSQAWQIASGGALSLARRFTRGQRSYPGLVPIFTAFYRQIAGEGEAAVPAQNILDTTQLCELAEHAWSPNGAAPAPRPQGKTVLVTGALGMLGSEVVRALRRAGRPVRAVARRAAAPWEHVPGTEYVVADLATDDLTAAFADVDVVIHCAAETRGAWDAHSRNSVETARRVFEAAATGGAQRVLHISSLAVVSAGAMGNARQPASESSPVESDPKASGPYVWGKLASEELAAQIGRDHGLETIVIRPGALVDPADVDPPGRLGRRLGNLLVAVGSPREKLGVVETRFAARAIAWMATHPAPAPVVHLLAPDLPTKREFVRTMRGTNPRLRVLWVPRVLVTLASAGLLVVQKLLRPRRKAVNVAKAFARQHLDTTRSRELAAAMAAESTKS